jgi:hypothetical protein
LFRKNLRAFSNQLLNGKLKIKKVIFWLFLLVFHASKEKPNKMLKCIFIPTNIIPAYFFKKPKIIK